jgi:hypothetical protein
MSIATLILRTYVAPREVIDHWLAAPRHEGRALAMLLGGCTVVCVSVLPFLLDQPGEAPPEARVGAALFAWLAIAPLAFYGFAGLIQGVLVLLGSGRDGYHIRVALFWAMLAAAPLWLLNGAGLVMPVPGLRLLAGALSSFGFLFLVTFCLAAVPKQAHAQVVDGVKSLDRQ